MAHAPLASLLSQANLIGSGKGRTAGLLDNIEVIQPLGLPKTKKEGKAFLVNSWASPRLLQKMLNDWIPVSGASEYFRARLARDTILGAQ